MTEPDPPSIPNAARSRGRKGFRAAVFSFADDVRAAGEATETREGGLARVARPLLALLGYADGEVFTLKAPHVFAAPGKLGHRVDVAILRDGKPVVALCQRALGGDRYEARYHLREYMKAMGGEGFGILSDGRVIELFIDADQPGTLDGDPFLVVDIAALKPDTAGRKAVIALYRVTAWRFKHDRIATPRRRSRRLLRWLEHLIDGILWNLPFDLG